MSKKSELKVFQPRSSKQPSSRRQLAAKSSIESSAIPEGLSQHYHQETVGVDYRQDYSSIYHQTLIMDQSCDQTSEAFLAFCSEPCDLSIMVANPRVSSKSMRNAVDRAKKNNQGKFLVLVIPDVGSPILTHCDSLQAAANALRLHVTDAVRRFAVHDYLFYVLSGEKVDIKISPDTGAVKLRYGTKVVVGRSANSSLRELADGKLAMEQVVTSPSNQKMEEFDLF